MKRALPAIALIAALSLSACSGSGSKSDQSQEGGDDSASQAAAEQTSQAKKLDKDQVKKIIESTDADGQKFKTIDTAAASGSEALKALESSEFEPAKCKDMSMSALNASQASNGTTATGVSSDKTLTVALISLANEADATKQLKNSSTITEECSNVTVKSQGIEMKMSYKPFDATVDGADETVGISAKIDAGGQTVLSTDTVTSRVGNNIVTAANVADTSDKEVVPNTAEAFVEAVKNAG